MGEDYCWNVLTGHTWEKQQSVFYSTKDGQNAALPVMFKLCVRHCSKCLYILQILFVSYYSLENQIMERLSSHTA